MAKKPVNKESLADPYSVRFTQTEKNRLEQLATQKGFDSAPLYLRHLGREALLADEEKADPVEQHEELLFRLQQIQDDVSAIKNSEKPEPTAIEHEDVIKSIAELDASVRRLSEQQLDSDVTGKIDRIESVLKKQAEDFPLDEILDALVEQANANKGQSLYFNSLGNSLDEIKAELKKPIDIAPLVERLEAIKELLQDKKGSVVDLTPLVERIDHFDEEFHNFVSIQWDHTHSVVAELKDTAVDRFEGIYLRFEAQRRRFIASMEILLIWACKIKEEDAKKWVAENL